MVSEWQKVANRVAEKLGLSPDEVQGHILEVSKAIRNQMTSPDTVEIDLFGINYLRLSRPKLQKSRLELTKQIITERYNLGLFGGANDLKLKASIEKMTAQIEVIDNSKLIADGAFFLDRKAEFIPKKVKRSKIKNGQITPVKTRNEKKN